MVFDRQPVLCGDALLLRPLAASDFDSLYRIASDPCESEDRTQEPVFSRWFSEALHSRGALTVVDRSDGELIGTSPSVLHGRDEVEIGWTFLARSCWAAPGPAR